MPDDELLIADEVELAWSLDKLLSKHGYRVTCEQCGEEIINEREVYQDGQLLCQTCAGNAYFRVIGGAKAEQPRQRESCLVC